MNPETYTRKTGALARGRNSIPGARYFVTLCSKDRQNGLSIRSLGETILSETQKTLSEPDACPIAAVVMPDHVHLLFELGARLSLSQLLAKWKVRTNPHLKTRDLEWQRNFFEHRLRPKEDLESFGLYMLLNPYRAGLLSSDKPWSLTRIWKPEHFQFVNHLSKAGAPPEEWMPIMEKWRAESKQFRRPS